MTSTHNRVAFDEIYARVPPEQVARLREFRRTHPYKQITIGETKGDPKSDMKSDTMSDPKSDTKGDMKSETKWEYISCGRGEETLLLLPGALSVGESVFPFIEAFENEYRIIAPSYALALTMTGLCGGIAQILEKEELNQVHVLGGSYGGLVAQYFARQYPAKVRSLILTHTFVLTPKLAKPLWIAGKVFPALPRKLFARILRLRLNKILISTLRATKHPETEFWRAYLNEAIASDLLKEVFIHQNNCLLELARQPQFTPDDLKGWMGKVLIIESDDDPAIKAQDRALLRSTYPKAQVHTFHDAGHASSILKREEVFSIIRSFLRRRSAG